jgi:SPP1 family predicted phage head-tail adaptor
MAVKMTAPRLRHRVDIQNFTTTQNSNTGVITEGWTTYDDDVPAEVWPLSGREFVAAQSVQAGVSVRITIRYQAGILPRMRIQHEGVTYNILAVLPDSTLRRHLTLMCERGVNAG